VAGKFVLKTTATGKFKFDLLASNGNLIATSDSYQTKRGARSAIESVRKHAADAVVDDRTRAK
jgi:uncharacterized protein YegP (UPF0339 family)